jgi:UDP-2,3-diacylglucosamine hydrolase
MESKPVYVVSDTHLGAVPAATERAFRGFLRHVGEHAGELLINGDLFDFWFEYRTVIMREHYRVVAALADLVESGVPVTFVGGNHDAWGGSFLRDDVGIRVVDGPVEMVLGGRRTLVAHGDGVGAGDIKYRMLKAVIRSRASIFGFRALHPDLGRRIAQAASSTEHKAESGDIRSKNRAAFIQAWGRERLLEDPKLDLVLTGHAHVPAIEEVAPRRFYVNSGDWLRSYTYVVLPAGGGAPELRTWPVEG